MPNLNEFIGPRPTEKQNLNLEKIIGTKPCSKCDLDSNEYYWDTTNFIMSWTCPNNHINNIKVNE